jgi:hypothetical protein
MSAEENRHGVSEYSLVKDLIVVLYQYEFRGDVFTRYLQHHNSEELCAELPHTYAVTFVKKQQNETIPLGGFLVKTSYTDTHPNFKAAILQCAASIKPADSIAQQTKNVSVVKINVAGSEPLTEAEMERIAVDQFTYIGTGGNA